jgi:hypothetical protein
MSWSLKVSQGDLVLGGSSYAPVVGEAKLLQDLRHFILEHMGTDPSHPEYGSIIDGGTQNGQPVQSVIGTSNWQAARLSITSELRRICKEYQRTQINRAAADKKTYGKATLQASEILLEVGDISFEQNTDTMSVSIPITSGRNNQQLLQLVLPTVL